MKSLFPGFDHQDKPVDPCAGRHGGSPTSEAAFERALETADAIRERIFEFIRTRGQHGATSKEIAAWLGKPLNTISGRISELKHRKRIRVNGEKRDDCAVLVVNPK